MGIFGNYFNGKTVLVTGHTGFKGSWLSIWLRELGANVIGYSLDPYPQRNNFELSNLASRIIDVRGDIIDNTKLKSVFNEYKPEIVFHLAAQPLVRYSYIVPRETFEVNVMGTVNVLECARECPFVHTVINITSDKCYDNKEWVWGYRENDPVGGFDPYSASKGCSELVTNAYINSYFNRANVKQAVASVRAGNVIGGGDWSKDRIIPDCIRALEENKPIQVRNPKAVRPWQHVLEPLSGYLLLASKIKDKPHEYSGAWNFGPAIDSIISVEKVVDMVIERFGRGEWLDCSDIQQPHEAKLLNLDCSKAALALNWKPTLNMNQCFDLTTDWYKEYSREDVYSLCVRQIKQFLSITTQKHEWVT